MGVPSTFGERSIWVLVSVCCHASMTAHALASDTDCGARCLHYVINTIAPQRHEGVEGLISELEPFKRGRLLPFTRLADAARARGLDAYFMNRTKVSLRHFCERAIVHVDGNHFAVLSDVTASGWVLWWGCSGYRELSTADVASRVSIAFLAVQAADAQAMSALPKLCQVRRRFLLAIGAAGIVAALAMHWGYFGCCASVDAKRRRGRLVYLTCSLVRRFYDASS